MSGWRTWARGTRWSADPNPRRDGAPPRVKADRRDAHVGGGLPPRCLQTGAPGLGGPTPRPRPVKYVIALVRRPP
jgi:hypothetical protein